MRKLGIAVVALAGLLVAAPAEADDPRLVEIDFESAVLGRQAGVRVLLPEGWSADETWPLLFLLHGVGDDHQSWTDKTDVEGLTADLPFVVVMPEAGRSPEAGWYSDWQGDGPAWETFHLGELLPAMEALFSAGGARERRVVGGFSMGGFGAMSYAARHPDLFVGAASFSGAVDTTLAGPGGALVFAQLRPYAGTPDDRVWGPYETHEVVWRGHNPTDLATNLRPVALWVRTGNGVVMPGDRPESAPVEAGIYAMNLSFHDRLTRSGIAHTWVDRGHGTHDWPYWEDDLEATLPGLLALVQDPPPPPASFDYRFVEDEASVFAWTFVVTGRDGPAFTELTGVDGDGFTVAGVGTLAATAPDGRSVTVALSSTPTRVDLGAHGARASEPAGSAAPPGAEGPPYSQRSLAAGGVRTPPFVLAGLAALAAAAACRYAARRGTVTA